MWNLITLVPDHRPSFNCLSNIVRRYNVNALNVSAKFQLFQSYGF